ncbi:MAG: sulfatase [bacterium]|nr:sulfatase [bacterium]
MKAIMVMFDSLNRHFLPPYGCDWTHAPNFKRLAERTVTFDRSYVCSMPCMPARRDLHTGRPNFLHRSWGPLEPFDDSVPKMLDTHGVNAHLLTDHQHYWETGGATYHTQYTTWEFFRGQEGDVWKGQVAPEPATNAYGRNAADGWPSEQDRVNRKFMRSEENQPQYKTFAAGMDFIQRNHTDDNWFLQIETFDPHEPFFSQRKYKDLYSEHYADYQGPTWDWPPYAPVNESRELIDHMKYEYASLLSMCDSKLGDILDTMDEFEMWDDTMLIIWTDHGFLLSEHDCWAKVWMPFYEEVAHTPFFVWDPRSKKRGERRNALVQPAIDLGPTLLSFFGLEPTSHMLGKDLAETVASDAPVREASIFGLHGGQINVTDGRYVYMRAPAQEDNQPLYNYTLMPTHMRTMFSVEELQEGIELAYPFHFTKGCQTMRIPSRGRGKKWETTLYDVESDPKQENPLNDESIENRMIELMVAEMKKCDAPPEQFERMGLDSA